MMAFRKSDRGYENGKKPNVWKFWPRHTGYDLHCLAIILLAPGTDVTSYISPMWDLFSKKRFIKDCVPTTGCLNLYLTDV